MKAAFGKTFGGISTLTKGTYNALTSRFRRSDTVEGNGVASEGERKDQELDPINGAAVTGDRSSLGHSLTSSHSPPQPHHPPPLPQEDDVLYRKNNVYLKCRVVTTATDDSQATPTANFWGGSTATSVAVQSLRSLQSGSQGPHTDRQGDEDKVPGFMFIASRGSNYGSTLILNWAPNSSIIKCSGSINSSICTAGQPSSDLTTSCESTTDTQTTHSSSDFSIINHQSHPPSSPSLPARVAATVARRPEHHCVSIDLGEMEIIRVFYRSNERGCIVSGEMVVSSRQTDIWVFQFQNGGLTDLINLFCCWDYFNHQEHRCVCVCVRVCVECVCVLCVCVCVCVCVLDM